MEKYLTRSLCKRRQRLAESPCPRATLGVQQAEPSITVPSAGGAGRQPQGYLRDTLPGGASSQCRTPPVPQEKPTTGDGALQKCNPGVSAKTRPNASAAESRGPCPEAKAETAATDLGRPSRQPWEAMAGAQLVRTFTI